MFCRSDRQTYFLKSNQRGIETGTTGSSQDHKTAWNRTNVELKPLTLSASAFTLTLKSNQRGIETKEIKRDIGSGWLLKSNQRGIETMWRLGYESRTTPEIEPTWNWNGYCWAQRGRRSPEIEPTWNWNTLMILLRWQVWAWNRTNVELKPKRLKTHLREDSLKSNQCWIETCSPLWQRCDLRSLKSNQCGIET